jgi:hypothetical protein
MVVLSGLGACGGPSAQEQQEQDYIAALDRARATLVKELQRLDDTAGPTGTPASDARTLAAYERAVAQARLDLRDIKPPQSVTTEHRKLLTALRGYELALSRARALGARTKTDKVFELRGQLDDAVKAASAKVDEAVAAVRARLAA